MTNKRGVKTGYGGNCRMIEIGSPGHPFRLTFNVDRIDSIRFEETTEEQEIRVPDVLPPETETRLVHTGWVVLVIANGAQNGINFPTIESAMSCYNSIISMIKAVGVPHVFMGPLHPPPPDPSIVGPDGQVIADAVDAAELHKGIAGDNEGDGIAENDDGVDLDGPLEDAFDTPPLDDEFELTDEDLALLENPEFEEDTSH